MSKLKRGDLEQWDGFRHIFKFTIFDIEEECRNHDFKNSKVQKGKIDFVCGHVSVVTSKNKNKNSNKIGIIICVGVGCGTVSYFLCISIVSGLESRGLSKLFIVKAKGLLN